MAADAVGFLQRREVAAEDARICSRFVGEIAIHVPNEAAHVRNAVSRFFVLGFQVMALRAAVFGQHCDMRSVTEAREPPLQWVGTRRTPVNLVVSICRVNAVTFGAATDRKCRS